MAVVCDLEDALSIVVMNAGGIGTCWQCWRRYVILVGPAAVRKSRLIASAIGLLPEGVQL